MPIDIFTDQKLTYVIIIFKDRGGGGIHAHAVPEVERKRPIETLEDASNAISVLEKARAVLMYPENELSRDPALRKHVGERLREWYIAEK